MAGRKVHEITRSSRVGRRYYPVPDPLRFSSIQDARKHIKENKLKVTQQVSHTRGERIQVVDDKGKARTISIERRPSASDSRDTDQEKE